MTLAHYRRLIILRSLAYSTGMEAVMRAALWVYRPVAVEVSKRLVEGK